METTQHIRLTSAEMANLWTSYMLESLVHHVFQHFLTHVEDPDIKSYIEYCHTSPSKEHIQKVSSVLQADRFPVPRGITSDDIDPKAPRLFSDIFYMKYIRNMAEFALIMYASAYTTSSRDDIRQLFKKFLSDLEIVDQKGTEIMLSKGLYNRPPSIPAPKEVDLVKKQNFLTGFFGNKRPLSVMEISQLFINAQFNAVGKALITGFSQVAKSKEIRQFFIRGKEISNKYYKLFTDILIDEDLTAPPSYGEEVMNSTEPPFSDRLMLFHVDLLGSFGISNYGVALSTSQRRDLAAMYARIIAEAGAYAEDGANLLIKKGWMEQPPLAPDRDVLTSKSKK